MSRKEMPHKKMSRWNKAYLDALEVPVWVPLRSSADDVIVDEGTVKDDASSLEKVPETTTRNPVTASTVANAEPQTTSQYISLHGDKHAKFAFVIDANMDLKSALSTFKQLQFAWQAWLDESLSAVLIQQVTSNSDEKASELFDVDNFSGHFIDCCGMTDSADGTSQSEKSVLERPSIAAPMFDFRQADKKAWWTLLQRLH